MFFNKIIVIAVCNYNFDLLNKQMTGSVFEVLTHFGIFRSSSIVVVAPTKTTNIIKNKIYNIKKSSNNDSYFLIIGDLNGRTENGEMRTWCDGSTLRSDYNECSNKFFCVDYNLLIRNSYIPF